MTLPDGTLRRYLFDLDSNRTEIRETPPGGAAATVATYTYDPGVTPGLDQLTSVTQGTTTTFSYNPDGEVTARGADSLTWDGRGRLTGGTFGGSSVSYGFDAAGRRRQRMGGGATTRYLFAGPGGAPVFETDGPGAITLTAVEGPAGDLAHYAGPPTTASTATFLYYNGHGDLAATADLSGSRTAAYTYDPFGGPRQAQPANAAVERWTGRWDKKLDTLTSLVEMGVRPYDPALGRFLAVDPIEDGDLNAYLYAGADPINNYDLDGHFCMLGRNPNGSCRGARVARAVARGTAAVGRFAWRNRWNIAITAGLAFTGWGLAARAAAVGLRVRVGLHGAHHAFGRVGYLRHIQINWWRTGVRGSGRAFRIPLPWR